MPTKSLSTLSDICEELGTTPQFLLNLSESASSLYTTFDRPKRRGGVRTISVPNEKLKTTQRLILHRLLSRVDMPSHLHGCVKGRSIVTNASEHINKPLVMTIDLKNFFNTINFEVVQGIYKRTFDCDDAAAETLARLSTYGNFLPQGAPTSPTLANIAALDMDKAIIEIFNRNFPLLDFSYTRYVDDITISGSREMLLVIEDIYEAIEASGFRANPKKVRIARPCSRQTVTGVIVNEKLNAPKKLIRKLRQQIYYCRKFGLEDHCKKIGARPYLFIEQLRGLIGHVRMMRPELADEFEVAFYEPSHRHNAEAPPNQLRLLRLLTAIENEKIVKFLYDRERCKAAPSEISVDENGFKILRAFQLRPKTGWRIFDIRSISTLEILD